MNIFHKDLQRRWGTFSTAFQMANIGSEVGRAISWRKKKNKKMWRNAFYRALELIDFTIDYKKNTASLKEICRMRELLVDYFFGDNLYQSSDASWERYFSFFNMLARNG